MKTKHIACLLSMAALAAGCKSTPSSFYTLTATAQGCGSPDAPYSVAVGPVTVPALVDRPQFTVQVAPNRIVIDEFNRWAAPLNENVARVVSTDLAVLLGTPEVATTPVTSFDPAYRVTINIQRFDSIRHGTTNDAALLEAVWVVRNGAANVARSGHTLAREPAAGQGFDALAAAHSRAVAKLSGDIAGAIQALAAGKP